MDNQTTKKYPPNPEDWKIDTPLPNFKDAWLLRMAQLGKHLRLQNLTKEEILDKVLRNKLHIITDIEDKDKCSLGEVKSMHLDWLFSKLVPTVSKKEIDEPTAEDIEIGFEVFNTITYCPISVFKLYRFIKDLLSSKSSRTIIQSMVNLFQSRILKDKAIFALAKEFYLVLASTLQMEYGNVLLATSTKSQIQSMIDDDLPFFTNNTEMVKTCLNDLDCDSTQDILQRIGDYHIISWSKIFFFADEGISRNLLLHPVHLIPDKEGQLPPSALIPFCSYQGETSMLGQRRKELNNLTVCDKFEPTILEGQLCYSIDVAQTLRRPKEGKSNGLWILVDPNPYKKDIRADTRPQFKVRVQTLAQYTAFGPGEYAMSSLKMMSGTEKFKRLPENQKYCQARKREDCERERFFDDVRNNCDCVPWVLSAFENIAKVGAFLNVYF